MKVAVVRGAFLNRYEMQFYEPLAVRHDMTAFGSLRPMHDSFAFPVVKLPSPMDLPDFPYKMPVLNRLFVDAHYLLGLERRLAGFDLVHSAETYYGYTWQSLMAKKSGRVKRVVATVLENIPFNNEGIWGRKTRKAFARAHLDRMIALTEGTKQVLIKEGADPARISVLGHFIDTKRFNPGPAKRPPGILTVLYCGRLEEEKGVMDLLRAFALLVKEPSGFHGRIRLRMVGGGTLADTVRAEEKRLGIADLVSHEAVPYDRMPDVYRSADIYVAPSKASPTWMEQYNTTLLEAQASGLPIVTTKSGGIPYNVGDAALLVAPGDHQALAEAISRFIQYPSVRRTYGQKARNRAVRVHDKHIGARKLARIYDEVLAAPPVSWQEGRK